jgi:hypothetical protein
MSGQIPRSMGSIALVATLLVWIVSFGAPTITAHADDCLAEPNSAAPAGSHWHYHTDRATQRKCWYIRATDQPAQPAAAQATSDPASNPASLPPAAPIPVEKPATASASGRISISPDGSTAPSPRIKTPVKPQRASVSGAATDQSAQQGAQKATPQASPALSIQAPVPQASPSSQTSDQGPTTRSAPTPAWPDPPAITSKTQEPTAPPRDARTESLRPTVDTSVSDDAKSTSRGGPSTSNPTGTTTSTSLMPVKMFAIAVLGLVVAGFLLRVVMKISVGRRRRIAIDRHGLDRIDDRLEHELHEDQIVHQRDALSEYLQRSTMPAATDSGPRRLSRVGNDQPDVTRAGDFVSHITNKISMRERRRIDVDRRDSDWSDDQAPHRWSDDQRQHEPGSIGPPETDWIDNRRQHEGRNDQQEHGSAGEADELLDDLQRSLLAAASDYRPRPPLQADDEWSNNGPGKDGASPISDEIKEREEALERLRRDLDRLLQSPKVA